MSKEFSCTSFSTTSLKQRIDKECLKNDRDIDKDIHIAHKIADRINYDVKANNGKLSLSNRFELVAMGYELKSKIKEPAMERNITIYRKEKRNDTFNSPQTAFEGYGVHKPVLSTARGFYRTPTKNTDSGFETKSSVSSSCSFIIHPVPSPSTSSPSTPSHSSERVFFGRKSPAYSQNYHPSSPRHKHNNNNKYSPRSKHVYEDEEW